MRFVFRVQVLVVECRLSDDVSAECGALLDVLPPLALCSFLCMGCYGKSECRSQQKYVMFHFPDAKVTMESESKLKKKMRGKIN
jgi:hypothetical protein